jgi:lipoate-protein ligase A
VLGAGRSPDCFKSTTQADLQSAGRKLIGSAQTRRTGVVLQHGSLYLRYPADLASRVFGESHGDAASLSDMLGREPAWEEVKHAFITGLAAELGLHIAPGELTDWELARAQATAPAYASIERAPR